MNRKERRNKNKEISILDEVLKVINQYFPDLVNQFEGLKDKRNQSYVKYKMKVIFIVRLMGLMCEIKTMHELTREFNTEETIKNIAKICGLELDEIPHCDTINDVFKNIEIREIEKIRKYIITRLIRSKMLDKFRIRDNYFHVVVDGSGLTSSRIKYNDSCLVKNKTDKNGVEYKEYSTYVLEAKLVLGDMVFSIGSEFVENEKDASKQDCEINAFKRLAEKIKKEYPKLKIVLGADALYAGKTVIDICEKNNWKYIIRFKEGAIPTLYKEFETLAKNENECKIKDYTYVTKLDYQEEKVNVIKYVNVKNNIEYVYLTDLPISDKNIESTIEIGRKRWKIENEGFNVQKKKTFDISHLCCRNQTAIKVHYILIQIAHIIRQLIENGIKGIKELKMTLKEVSQKLKRELTSAIKNVKAYTKIQLRFD